MKIACLLVLLLTSLPCAATDISKRDLLDLLVEQYGGASNLAKMDVMIQDWTMTTGMNKPGGTDTRHFSSPDRLRVELNYPDRREVRLLIGNHGFQIVQGGQPRIAQKALRNAMRLQLMRLYSPLMLRRNIENLELVNQGQFLALSWRTDEIRVDYLIDTTRWVIEKVAGTLDMNGAEMQFLTEYSDFRKVEGVLMHHHENKFAGNVATATLDLDQVHFVELIDEKIFSPDHLGSIVPAPADPI